MRPQTTFKQHFSDFSEMFIDDKKKKRGGGDGWTNPLIEMQGRI